MLQVKNITFSYKQYNVIKNIDFSVNKGQNIAIIGESGCGKSTLLKLIYGLYDLNEGQIFWNDQEVLGPKFHLVPGMPYMKYLAQDFDLMPFITVAENVGKYLSNIHPEKKQKRINELLEIVEMTAYSNIKAKFLSGGQQQRVALAKVLALEPEVLLLDEPFSQIDNFRKNSLRRNLFSYLKSKEITCLVATHDSTDSLSFADETLVLNKGEIVVKEKSTHLYKQPINKYVASLFGDVNEIKSSQLIDIDCDDEILLLFPNQLKMVASGKFKVKVKHSFFKGSHFLIQAEANETPIFFEHNSELKINSEVFLSKK
ncbi:MAG: ABC transporter ATP-binding protein [Flavobacterium sp.]|nr:ABC transporter ATP-binding protein [Flavobacterium sp.]